MKKIELLNFELGLPFSLMQRAAQSLDTSLLSFEAAVGMYHNFFKTGIYNKLQLNELLPVVQAIVFNCPHENHPIFVQLREQRKPYSRGIYVRPAA